MSAGTPKLTPENMAEHAGAVIAKSAIDAMRKASTQAQRLVIFEDALIDIFSSTEGGGMALCGFTAGFIAYVERGIGVIHE